MSREVASVLEGELLLAAALDWTGGHQATCVRVAQDFASELLVDQNRGGVPGHVGLEREKKTLVDEPLGVDDLRDVLRVESVREAEQAVLE